MTFKHIQKKLAEALKLDDGELLRRLRTGKDVKIHFLDALRFVLES